MASEDKAQAFVHELEHGRGRWWVTFLLIVAIAAYQMMTQLFINPLNKQGNAVPNFRGLDHAKGMEQAVISRELVRGHGFSTLVIKPAAIALVEQKLHSEAAFSDFLKSDGPTGGNIPDYFHSPLNPWLNSLALRAAVFGNERLKVRTDEKGAVDFWASQKGDYYHPADLMISALSLLFFFASVVMTFLTARRLFDDRLATLVVLLLLLCNRFWEFSATGLPQLLMLFLFSVATHLFLKALEAREGTRPVWPWLSGAGLCFGLLAISHPLGVFLFIGAAIYTTIAFRPYGLWAGVMALIVMLCIVPWGFHNQKVCGDFWGLGVKARAFQLRGTESQIMRTLTKTDDTIEPTNFLVKIQGQMLAQLDGLYKHLGKIVPAPFFFIALLHFFRRSEARSLRWGIFCMWLFAVLGMALYGFSDYDLLAELQSNDLHLLFIPMMTTYGLAFILVLWSRVETQGREVSRIPMLNNGFQTLLVVSSSISLLATYTSPPRLPVNFPPYFPPVIRSIGEWYTERDIICSDMPWAVAWYGDRKSLWLPYTLPDFTELNEFRFNGHINGLLLTPVTGFRGLLSEVGIGEFREWASFIMRDPRVRSGFPLSVPRAFSIANGSHYILYADKDRWTERQ